MPNVVLIKVTRLSDRREEGRAAAEIYPGMLIAKNSSGTLIPHATAGGGALLRPEYLIALEDPYVGKTIDDPYAIGDLVFYHVAQNGDEIQARLKHGAGNTYVINSPVTSDGAGNFKLATGTDQVVGRVLEPIDLAAAGAPAFGKVRLTF